MLLPSLSARHVILDGVAADVDGPEECDMARRRRQAPVGISTHCPRTESRRSLPQPQLPPGHIVPCVEFAPDRVEDADVLEAERSMKFDAGIVR